MRGYHVGGIENQGETETNDDELYFLLKYEFDKLG